MELIGNAQWNDLEGGFWSLVTDATGDGPGEVVVLVFAELPSDLADAARIRVQGSFQEGVVDFFMAGRRFEVNELVVLG